jgi:glutamine synthetase
VVGSAQLIRPTDAVSYVHSVHRRREYVGPSAVDPETLASGLARSGAALLMIAWVDNNEIARSRPVPTPRLAHVAGAGVGVSTLFAVFAVFDSHDGITFEHEGLATASGDVRLLPVVDRITHLAGHPRAQPPSTRPDH